MVKIDTTLQTQQIFIPFPVPAPASGVSLTAHSTTDHADITIPVSAMAVQGFLLRATIDLENVAIHPGEWEYSLHYTNASGQQFAAVGLILAHEGQATGPVQYNADSNYKQYGE